jgi:tnp2 family transposase/uncharacterized protein DUF4218
LLLLTFIQDCDDAGTVDLVDLFLELAEWSQGIPRAKYTALKKLLSNHNVEIPSMRRVQSRLQTLTKIKPLFIDCCFNNCVAFTKGYADATECPICNEKRYGSGRGSGVNAKRARKRFVYIPIIDRLKLQYKNAARAQILSTYRHSFNGDDSHGKLRDVFDGKLYREFHCEKLKLFRDARDVAFHLSLDGVQVTNMRHHEVTPVILINLNLPPEERYKIENIMASMIIPGPNKPKELDTFLRPLVDELNRLDHGTKAFDAYTGSRFTLKAWVTMVTGDGPAIAEAIGFKRPGNALSPCRHCTIESEMGESASNAPGTYYVPHTNYDFNSPPLRGDNLRDVIKLVVDANSPDYCTQHGITRASILLELRSLHFPRSFPIDIMHCVLLNITENLYKLWSRKKLAFETCLPPVENRHLSEASIKTISESLVSARGDIPTYLSRAPRRIDKHYKGYKAAEWEAWLKHYGPPLLDQHLGNDYVRNFCQLGRIYSLATQHEIQAHDIPHLNALTIDFVREYERLYYCQEKKRLPVCSVNIHSLLHIAPNAEDTGPLCYAWQFPMERYCGIIKPMARSKSQLSVSLANGVITTELLNHVRFTREEEPAAAPQNSYPILLDSLMTKLTPFSRRCLLAHLSNSANVQIKCYKRCQLTRELTIGSAESQRGGDLARRNDRICYQIPGQQGFAFASLLQFAKVIYPQERCLAWVRIYDGVNIDHAKRVASYTREGRCCWIEVGWIKSLLGVIKEGSVNLLVTDVDLFD